MLLRREKARVKRALWMVEKKIGKDEEGSEEKQKEVGGESRRLRQAFLKETK